MSELTTITDAQVETALTTWFKGEISWDKGMAPWSADQFRAEMRATLEAALAAAPTPPPSSHVEWGDWTVDDTDTAREIMNYLGYGSDASREPGADRRRDKIAAMIRARIDAATAPAPEKHVRVTDEMVDAAHRYICGLYPYPHSKPETRQMLEEAWRAAPSPQTREVGEA